MIHDGDEILQRENSQEVLASYVLPTGPSLINHDHNHDSIHIKGQSSKQIKEMKLLYQINYLSSSYSLVFRSRRDTPGDQIKNHRCNRSQYIRIYREDVNQYEIKRT
jgi:hypothetical protein